MSHPYVAVQWTRYKLIYDGILASLVVLYLVSFILVSHWIADLKGVELETNGVAIRAYGSAAFILLNITLSIGPLSRIHSSFHTLLFNRRHMGVMVFLLGSIHVGGWALPSQPWVWFGLKTPKLPWQFNGAVRWYNNFGDLDPLVSLLTGNRHLGNPHSFPFELLGVVGLLVLFIMAATSHDFWLANLTPPVWKTIHMGVYVGYTALVGHVLLGCLQTNRDPWLAILVFSGAGLLLSLHLVSGWREWRTDAMAMKPSDGTWLDVGAVDEIRDGQAKVLTIRGERVAVFRHGEAFFALSNVCAHQNGPLGEGRVVNGCAVCPWHGYEYELETGASPPPFTESVPTFPVEIRHGRVLIDTTPTPALVR
ncbi:MAG: Rieske 2Fe-2S domain-containing protein [Synechococcus sp.]